MERNYGLNLAEQQEFKSMVSTLIKDSKVQDLCLKYYSEFRKHQTSIQSDKISLYLKCAYYLAQKSQWMQTINGQKVRSAGFSLNELLKKHTLQDIMITLKQYSKRITIQDPQTLDDLQKLIKQISFLITFYNKFEKVLAKLQLKDKNPGYAQTISEFVWLLFIDSKNKILNRSLQLIDNTCMLAHALCFVLIYSWEFYQPGLFLKPQMGLNKISSRKQINTKIHEKILELFLIKNIQSYKNIAQRFQAYFSYLKKNNVIRMSPSKDNFLSPEFLQSNYKRLDQIYEKKLNFNHLDERIFFKDRTANITPSKFTPFARQKVHIPNNRPKLGGNIGGFTQRSNQPVNYMSHRILNYENLQSQTQVIQPQVPPSQIKFPKNIMQTPISTNTPLIQQTPYTTGLMMYNYVNQLSNRLQQKKFCSRKIDQLIFSLIDQVLDHAMKDQNQKSREIKRNHIFSVFKIVSEDFISIYQQDSDNQQMMKALLLLSFQIVFFVSNIDVEFDKLEKELSIGEISLWRACDFFLKFDKSMPANIKVHLLDLEVDIVSQKIWKNYQTIAKVQSFCNNQKITKDQQLIQKLCRRILHQMAFQIVQLCKNLPLQSRQVQQSTSQIAFDTMKQILINHPYMIWSNNIDQIIMCAIYSISRCWKFNIKFQNIRDAYLNCNAHLSDSKKIDIFKKIQYETQNNQNQNKGIVGFYNDCFILIMNQFVKNKCQNIYSNQTPSQTQRPNTQKDINPLLQSPISGIIPNQINYAVKKMNNVNNKMLPMKNTTPRLHAYTESPMLKNDFVTVKNPIHSRKAIDFQQAEKNLIGGGNKKQILNDTCKLYQQNTQTNTFFNKKFAAMKPGNKLISDIPALIKSPCNNQTKSPSQSSSPRVDNTVVKQPYSNLYYKRDFGKSMNNYM